MMAIPDNHVEDDIDHLEPRISNSPKKKVLSGASPAKPASAVQAKPEQKQEEKKVKQQ